MLENGGRFLWVLSTVHPHNFEPQSTHEVGGYGWLRENEWVFHRDNRSIIDDFRSTNCSAWRAARVCYRARRIAMHTAEPARAATHVADLMTTQAASWCAYLVIDSEVEPRKTVVRWVLGCVWYPYWRQIQSTEKHVRHGKRYQTESDWPLHSVHRATQHNTHIHKHLHLATHCALVYVQCLA